MRDRILVFERKVGKAVAFVASTTLVAAVFVALWQVTSRFVLRSPSDWSEVLTRLLLIWCVYLGAAIAFRRGALVSVDLLQSSLKGRFRVWLDLAITMLTISFLLAIGALGAQLAWKTRFQTIAGLEIAISWGYLAIPVGATLGVLAALAHHLDPARRQLETSL